MSNVSQGNRHEVATRDLLRSQGWRCETVRRPGRFSGGDPFGIVDLIAIGDEGCVQLVQVGTHGKRAEKVRKIEAAGLGLYVMLVLWRKQKGVWVSKTDMIWSGSFEPPGPDVSDALSAAEETWRNVV